MRDCWTTREPTIRNDRLGPRVGIFFVYENRLLIEGAPFNEAQPYSNFIGHAKGHPAFWTQLQRDNAVPREVEYDEVPRGRVGYQTKEDKFYVFLDPCIMADKKILDQIKRELNLPPAKTASPRLDSHYICPGCKKRTKEQLKEEEADWDF